MIQTTVEHVPRTQLDAGTLLEAYRTMRTIREFEERLHVEFATGEIPGFVHLYAGEEAIATGVCMHLREGDRIASTHRGTAIASRKASSSTGWPRRSMEGRAAPAEVRAAPCTSQIWIRE